MKGLKEIKVKRNSRLTKKKGNEIEIGIDSPIFRGLLKDADKEIRRCFEDMAKSSYNKGTINIRLKMELKEERKVMDAYDEDGKKSKVYYKYRKPVFSHRVTSSLKKSEKVEGKFNEEREMVKRKEGMVLAPIIDEGFGK